MKRRKCDVCKTEYQPSRIGQEVCGVDCSIESMKQKRVKKKTAAYKTRRKKKADSIGRQLELTQKVFNQWIRWRDRDQPCISSGRMTSPQWHAGHYVAVGNSRAGSMLRFDESNVHKQCVEQNMHQGAALTAYRIGLIERIGLDEVQRLEATNGTRKWSIPELKELRAEYRKRLREAD